MKNVVLGLLGFILAVLIPLAIITGSGLPSDPSIVILIGLPAALLALTLIGWIQKWDRHRLLLGILIGPLLLLTIRFPVVIVDKWFQPLTNPSRLPLALALDLGWIFLCFLATHYLYFWLLGKLDRRLNGDIREI